jgi:archaemetzincin
LRIALLPIGEVNEAVVSHLASELSAFGEVDVLRAVDIPESAYRSRRRQYLASDLMKLTAGFPQDKVIGITEVDTYEGSKRFVFGLAEVGGKSAIVSLSRLNGNPEVIPRRATKEVVHELGHTFGLRHCPDKSCVMTFSNSLGDTDFKEKDYCRSCALVLRNSGILTR